MTPKHFNPVKNRSSHAPYNFVPLPEKVVTVDSNIDQDSYMARSLFHKFRYAKDMKEVIDTFVRNYPYYARS